MSDFIKKFRVSAVIALLAGLPAFSQETPPTPAETPVETIEICSFNIQFLGSFEKRDNQALAELMKEEACDIVVVQELVAPPAYDFLKKNHLVEINYTLLP